MLSFVLLLACSGGGEGAATPTVLSEPLTRVTIEVDYGPGAEPRTGGFGPAEDLWELSQVNVEALFPGVEVDVPHTLVEMQALGEVPEGDDGAFTAQELVDLSARVRDSLPGPGQATFHALFLDGRFADEDGIRDNVLGVSLRGTTIAAVFVPVVDGAALTEPTRAFVEQTTLIHELGHAIGLVNTGLDMVEPHEDADHPGHDVSDACVMYWANEGPSDLVEFVLRVIRDDSVVLFDGACQADVASGFELSPKEG